MRNIKLLLEYDGTDFVGWQAQAIGRTVQEELVKAIHQLLQEPVNLIGAGRTDSGVHARGQVANFRTHSLLALRSIRDGLNAILPDDVCVQSAEDVAETFHARYDARERCYRYFIARKPSPIGRRFQWFVRFDLDMALMNLAAEKMLGEHDFGTFCRVEAEAKHHRCTVVKSVWVQEEMRLVYEIRANRFLHGMVRALVGHMIDVGRGHVPPSEFDEIMTTKDRRRVGMSAPAVGLVLEEVVF